LVVTIANYPPRMIATNKENGRVVWETNLSDGQPELQFSAAPLAVKGKIILGAAGGDRGVRDFIVAVDAATGRSTRGPGRPAASCGAWIRGRRRSSPRIAVQRCGAPPPVIQQVLVGWRQDYPHPILQSWCALLLGASVLLLR
jgi:outer membrane protein assembly factor BamB